MDKDYQREELNASGKIGGVATATGATAARAPTENAHDLVSYGGFNSALDQWFDRRLRERGDLKLPGTDALITGVTPDGKFIVEGQTGDFRNVPVEKAHIDYLMPRLVAT